MLTFNKRTAHHRRRGIGKAIAETLAGHGVTVICVSKSPILCVRRLRPSRRQGKAGPRRRRGGRRRIAKAVENW